MLKLDYTYYCCYYEDDDEAEDGDVGFDEVVVQPKVYGEIRHRRIGRVHNYLHDWLRGFH